MHLYGQEVNPETYAISKVDLILKDEGARADNMQCRSTLSAGAFPDRKLDFMPSNPPYRKNWKANLQRSRDRSRAEDHRFIADCARARLLSPPGPVAASAAFSGWQLTIKSRSPQSQTCRGPAVR